LTINPYVSSGQFADKSVVNIHIYIRLGHVGENIAGFGHVRGNIQPRLGTLMTPSALSREGEHRRVWSRKGQRRGMSVRAHGTASSVTWKATALVLVMFGAHVKA